MSLRHEKNTSNMADVRRWRHRVTSLQVLYEMVGNSEIFNFSGTYSTPSIESSHVETLFLVKWHTIIWTQMVKDYSFFEINTLKKITPFSYIVILGTPEPKWWNTKYFPAKKGLYIGITFLIFAKGAAYLSTCHGHKQPSQSALVSTTSVLLLNKCQEGCKYLLHFLTVLYIHPLRTEVYFCHQNQNAKNIGNLMTLLKPHNIGTHLKGIVPLFFKSYSYFGVS
jgi:hypothetical protein